MDFYAALKQNGAVQVSTPDDVTTGVAQGIYDAGMTTANSAYAAKEDGSPVDVSWPEPGRGRDLRPDRARQATAPTRRRRKGFISYVISEEGQRVIGGSGSYPTLAGVPGPTMPAGAPGRRPRLGGDRDAARTTC